MEMLWVITAAFIGIALHLIVNQFTGAAWNWKVFVSSLIMGIITAAGFGVSQTLTGNTMIDIIGALIGGFTLATGTTLTTAAVAMKKDLNETKTQIQKLSIK